MDTSGCESWNLLVEQAVLDIQDNISLRKEVPEDQCESLLPFLNTSIIQEICLERNWNNICSSFTCGNFRRVIAKEDDTMTRSWFCSKDCFTKTCEFSQRAGNEHPNSRNIVAHLCVLYPHISYEKAQSLYIKTHGYAESEIKKNVSDTANDSGPWKTKATPPPRKLAIQTTLDLAQKMRDLSVEDEKSSSSDDEDSTFSLYQCFPLLSLLFDAWSTTHTALYLQAGDLAKLPVTADSPNRKDMEYILEEIGAALAAVRLSLERNIIDEIPHVISTLDFTRNFSYQDLMKEANVIDAKHQSGSWLSFALVILHAIAQHRYPMETANIESVTLQLTSLTPENIRSLAGLLSKQVD